MHHEGGGPAGRLRGPSLASLRCPSDALALPPTPALTAGRRGSRCRRNAGALAGAGQPPPPTPMAALTAPSPKGPPAGPKGAPADSQATEVK